MNKTITTTSGPQTDASAAGFTDKYG